MASKSLLAALALLLLLHFSSAVEFTVGDSNGWTFQVNYTQWASSQTFRVGDILVFPYTSIHDVLEVSQADYDSCDGSNAVTTYATASPIRVTLSRPGAHWFLCGIPGHCAAGMRVPINVAAATFTATAPAPSPSARSGGRALSPRSSLATSPSPSPTSSLPASPSPSSPSPSSSLAPSPSPSPSPRSSLASSPSPSPSASSSPAPSTTVIPAPDLPPSPPSSDLLPPASIPTNALPPASPPSSSAQLVSIGWGLTIAGLLLAL